MKNETNEDLKLAIKKKCLDCVAASKKEIILCPDKKCPLWDFRPYKK